MNVKKTILLFTILVMLAISPCVVDLIMIYRADHFSCRGKIDFSDNKRDYTVQVKYIFNGGRGEVTTLGEYSDRWLRNRRISQQLLFDYTHNGDELVMLSTNSALSDEQARMLDKLVPDFYLYKDRGFRIRIFRQGDSGYVFTTYDIPVFICTKI
jgi:hypothetical protein